MAVEEIYVVCDKCGNISFTGMAVELSAIETSSFRNNKSRCSCGHLILWSKAELWPESLAKERMKKTDKPPEAR